MCVVTMNYHVFLHVNIVKFFVLFFCSLFKIINIFFPFLFYTNIIVNFFVFFFCVPFKIINIFFPYLFQTNISKALWQS